MNHSYGNRLACATFEPPSHGLVGEFDPFGVVAKLCDYKLLHAIEH